VLLLASVLAAVCAAAPARAGIVRYAVVAGNNLGLASAEPLRFAERDAERMGELLVDLGRVLPENLAVLRGAGPDDLRRAFDDVADRAARADGDVVFVFYYSGHADSGWLRMGGQGIALEEIRRRLEELPVKVRVAIVDACQSGAITRAKGGKVVSPFLEDLPVRVEGLVILTSASAAEAAQESDVIGSSFFSHHLMSGLRGPADASGDGAVSAVEAYDYAYRLTVRETEGTAAGAQHPTFLYALEGEGDVPLTMVGLGRARVELDAAVDGTLMFLDSRGGIAAEVVKRAGAPMILALVPGRYEVRWRPAEGLYSATLHLADGDARSLGPGDFRWRPVQRGTPKGILGGTGPGPLPDVPLGGGASWGGAGSRPATVPADGSPAEDGGGGGPPDPEEGEFDPEGPGYDDSRSFARIEGARLAPPLAFGISLVGPGVPQIINGEGPRGGALLGVFTAAAVGSLALGRNADRFRSDGGRAAGLAGAAALGYAAFYAYAFSAVDAFYSVTRGGPGLPDLDEVRVDLDFSLATSLGRGPRGDPDLGFGGGFGAGFALLPHWVVGLRELMVVDDGRVSTYQFGPELGWRALVAPRLALSVAAGAIFQVHVERAGVAADLGREDPDRRTGWSVLPCLGGGLHFFPARSWSLDFGLRGGVSLGTRQRLGGAPQPDRSFTAEYTGGMTWYL
jgi:hypothetical protein